MIAALSLIAGWFTLMACFVAVMHAKLLMDGGSHKLSWFWIVNLAPIAALGFVLDVAFNMVVGTLLYAELPRELTFTSRCKRWKRVADDETSSLWLYRRSVARWWCRQLEQIDPGHC